MGSNNIHFSQCPNCNQPVRNAVACPLCGQNCCRWQCYAAHVGAHRPPPADEARRSREADCAETAHRGLSG